MGYDKIQGELLKFGFVVDPTTVKNVLRRHHLLPAPQRGQGSWRTFLNHYRQQLLACDFFTVETLHRQTVYVLFFIELGTRRVQVVGCTEHPTSAWVTQQARQLCWSVEGRQPTVRYLLHDHDTKFPASFDQVFAAQQIDVIHTPIRAPNANAFAER